VAGQVKGGNGVTGFEEVFDEKVQLAAMVKVAMEQENGCFIFGWLINVPDQGKLGGFKRTENVFDVVSVNIKAVKFEVVGNFIGIIWIFDFVQSIKLFSQVYNIFFHIMTISYYYIHDDTKTKY